MTAKTSKDAAEDAEGAAAEGRPDAAAKAHPARKKVRRVRVIEVIDDGEDDDLRDVLEVLDRQEEPGEGAERADRDGREAAETETDRTVEDKTEDKTEAEAEDGNASPAGSDTEPEQAESKTKPLKKPAKVKPKPAEDVPARRASLFGLPAVPAAVAVVLIAALATLSIVLWRSQHELSQREEARREVIKVVTDYGNAVLSYDRTDLKNSVERAHSFLTGDALTKARQIDIDQLQKSLDESRFSVTSKTSQVYVAGVDDMFASAVLVFDITFQSTSGTQEVKRNYLSLSLVRQDGTWKISQQKPAGRESDGTTDVTDLEGGQNAGGSKDTGGKEDKSKD